MNRSLEWDAEKINPTIVTTSDRISEFLAHQEQPRWERISEEELEDIWDRKSASTIVRNSWNVTFEAVGPYRVHIDFRTRRRIIKTAQPTLRLIVVYPSLEIQQRSFLSMIDGLGINLSREFNLARGVGDYANEGAFGTQYNFKFLDHVYRKI